MTRRRVFGGLAVLLALGAGALTLARAMDHDMSPEEREELARVYGLPPSASENDVEGAIAQETVVLTMADQADAYVDGSAEDSFAGMYLSQEGGISLLHVGFVHDMERHRANLRSRVNHPEYLRFFEATNTLEALRQVQMRITRDMEELDARGIEVSEVSVDQERNLVLITITKLSQDAKAELENRYDGEIIRVAEGELYRFRPDFG